MVQTSDLDLLLYLNSSGLSKSHVDLMICESQCAARYVKHMEKSVIFGLLRTVITFIAISRKKYEYKSRENVATTQNSIG